MNTKIGNNRFNIFDSGLLLHIKPICIFGFFHFFLQKSNQSENSSQLSAKTLIHRMGFDTAGIVDMRDYYLVEGDIGIKKSTTSTFARQAYNINSGKVSLAHQNNITIRISNSVPSDGGNYDWRNEVEQAIQEYNSIVNSNIKFFLVTDSVADIVVKTGILYDSYGRDYTVIAGGSWPDQGAPGSTITINSHYNQGYAVSSSQKKYNMIHELGHNIGFRHTNWNGLGESSGTQIGVSPNSGTNPDANSVFNGGTATFTWNGFSNWDIYSICYLYPLYHSEAKSVAFTRNNCSSGYIGTPVVYTVQAGTYTSTTSQADADQQAQNDVNTNGQAYANTHGTCVIPSTFTFGRINYPAPPGVSVSGISSATVQFLQNDTPVKTVNIPISGSSTETIASGTYKLRFIVPIYTWGPYFYVRSTSSPYNIEYWYLLNSTPYTTPNLVFNSGSTYAIDLTNTAL